MAVAAQVPGQEIHHICFEYDSDDMKLSVAYVAVGRAPRCTSKDVFFEELASQTSISTNVDDSFTCFQQYASNTNTHFST